jgi:serine/threonine protein kinase
MKIPTEHLSGKAEAKERFEREARATAVPSHPNICRLYDVGSQDGTSYLVMEYVEGETLADRLSNGPLPLEHVLKYAIEICEGLEHATRTVRSDFSHGAAPQVGQQMANTPFLG